jgi:uncharacterized membrane protein YbhN (UPF0104 family)
MIKINNQKIIFFIRLIIFILITFFIYAELNKYTIELASFNDRFKINFFILAIIFFVIANLIGTYNNYIIVILLRKIKLFYFSKIVWTGQLLDFFPFLGLVYKAKKLKDKIQLGYKKFLAIYMFLFKISIFALSTYLVIYYILPVKKNLNINVIIFYPFFIIFTSIIFLLLFNKFFILFFRKKKFSISLFKKKINLLIIFLIFLFILRKALLRNYAYLKCYALSLLANFSSFICFLLIFKTYQIDVSYIDAFLIYLLLVFSTQIPILPKNYGYAELIGSYLIQLSSENFVTGFSVMITLRIISLISTLLLFTIFNINWFKNKLNDQKK